MRRRRRALLHVHAQERAGESVYVLGNTPGLRELRNAIDRALRSWTGQARSAECHVADGELFRVFVVRSVRPEEWAQAAVPYMGITWDPAQEQRDGVTWPWERLA